MATRKKSTKARVGTKPKADTDSDDLAEGATSPEYVYKKRKQLIRSKGQGHRSWWNDQVDDIPGAVYNWMNHCRKALSERRRATLEHMSLYENDRRFIAEYEDEDNWGVARDNIVAPVVDTITSFIAQLRPMPYYLTNDGDWLQQRTAEARTDAIQGLFWDTGVYKNNNLLFKDACISDFACVQGYIDPITHKPGIKRVFSLNVLYDPVDGKWQDPRTMGIVDLVSREMLQSQYPKLAQDIADSSGPSRDDWEKEFIPGYVRDSTADQVMLFESWHLPESPDMPGLHVVCTSNVILQIEVWAKETYPLAFYRYDDRQVGFHGRGLVERLKEKQYRINTLIKKKEKLQDRNAGIWVITSKGGQSGTDPDELTNSPWQIIEVGEGERPPQAVMMNAVPQDLLQEIADLKQSAYEEAGISAGSVQGESNTSKSASGIAVRATDDIQSRRHIMPTRAWEDFHNDIGRVLMDILDELSEEDEKYTVRYPALDITMSRVMKKAAWKDLKLDDSECMIRSFPVSALPTTPQGKWAAISEWIDAGWIGQPMAMKLMDFPDMGSFLSDELADVNFVKFQISEIINGKKDVFPDPVMDLDLAANAARKSYLKLQTKRAPKPVVDAMLRYLNQIKAEIELAVQGELEQQGAAGAAQPPTQDPSQQPVPPDGSAPMAA